MSQKSVLIFTKVPSPGYVKTRLTQGTSLTKNDVALIAEAMLKDTLGLASESNADKIEIGYIPEYNLSNLEKIVDSIRIDGYLTKSITYHLQNGSNFDERFSSVVNASFKNNTKFLVILGADLPYLDPLIINTAFKQLSKSKFKEKVAIGPANGGGIYLVGIRDSFDSEWFVKHNLFRGGVEVLQFINLCKQENIELNILPPLIDIDIEEDLVSLITFIEALTIAKNYQYFHFPRYTAKVLNELGLYIKEVPDETRKRKISKLKGE